MPPQNISQIYAQILNTKCHTLGPQTPTILEIFFALKKFSDIRLLMKTLPEVELIGTNTVTVDPKYEYILDMYEFTDDEKQRLIGSTEIEQFFIPKLVVKSLTFKMTDTEREAILTQHEGAKPVAVKQKEQKTQEILELVHRQESQAEVLIQQVVKNAQKRSLKTGEKYSKFAETVRGSQFFIEVATHHSEIEEWTLNYSPNNVDNVYIEDLQKTADHLFVLQQTIQGNIRVRKSNGGQLNTELGFSAEEETIVLYEVTNLLNFIDERLFHAASDVLKGKQLGELASYRAVLETLGSFGKYGRGKVEALVKSIMQRFSNELSTIGAIKRMRMWRQSNSNERKMVLEKIRDVVMPTLMTDETKELAAKVLRVEPPEVEGQFDWSGYVDTMLADIEKEFDAKIGDDGNIIAPRLNAVNQYTTLTSLHHHKLIRIQDEDLYAVYLAQLTPKTAIIIEKLIAVFDKMITMRIKKDRDQKAEALFQRREQERQERNQARGGNQRDFGMDDLQAEQQYERREDHDMVSELTSSDDEKQYRFANHVGTVVSDSVNNVLDALIGQNMIGGGVFMK